MTQRLVGIENVSAMFLVLMCCNGKTNTCFSLLSMIVSPALNDIGTPIRSKISWNVISARICSTEIGSFEICASTPNVSSVSRFLWSLHKMSNRRLLNLRFGQTQQNVQAMKWFVGGTWESLRWSGLKDIFHQAPDYWFSWIECCVEDQEKGQFALALWTARISSQILCFLITLWCHCERTYQWQWSNR